MIILESFLLYILYQLYSDIVKSREKLKLIDDLRKVEGRAHRQVFEWRKSEFNKEAFKRTNKHNKELEK
jgi:hypothetical protein